MRYQKLTSCFLLIFLLFHSILLGSGLLGVSAEHASKICHCNHASKKEKHSHSEDKIFKKNRNHTKIVDIPLDPGSKIEMNCHTVKAGEVHICACKKTKSSMAKLAIFYQVWISTSLISLVNPETDDSVLFFSISDSNRDGWKLTLLKPPRQFTV